MTDKKYDSGFSFYIPLVLLAAFLLGCLSVALISVRENVLQITYSSEVSASDSVKTKKM